MKEPEGVAVDTAGNVFVADTRHDRILKFGPQHVLLAKWGYSGRGPGQFRQPAGIAVDAAGKVYVVDRANHRIQKFTNGGAFLKMWGSEGIGDGQFDLPTAIAVDATGNVYVADRLNDRIQKFSSTGAFLSKTHADDPLAVAVTAAGELIVKGGGGDCTAVAASRTGDIVARAVMLGSPGCAVEYESSSGFHRWGSYGGLPGQFRYPQGLAIDLAGDVYMADTGNSRIQRFSPTGGQLPAPDTPSVGEEYAGIAIDAAGNVYCVDSFNAHVLKFSNSGTLLAKWGSQGTGNGQFRFDTLAPVGIAVDASGNVYVADHGNDRIQKFTSTGAFVTKWGTRGSAPGQLWEIYGLAVDGAGNILVADMFRIQKFTSSGQFISSFGSLGSGNLQFGFCSAVAVNKAGSIYVLDTSNVRVQQFTAAGAFVRKWTIPRNTVDNWIQDGPHGLALDAEGNVYVADTNNDRMLKYSGTGTLLAQWGVSGEFANQFQQPLCAAVDAWGKVFVIDRTARVQAFAAKGCTQILSVSPRGTGVSLTPTVAIRFDRRMNKPSAQSAFALTMNGLTRKIGGAFTWVDNEMRFTPNVPLKPLKSYRVMIQGTARSTTGIELAESRWWVFKTVASAASCVTATATPAGSGAVIMVTLSTPAE